MKLIEAIAKIEGFGRAGAIPTRDHNPGDILDNPKDDNDFASRHGAIGNDKGFAIFANDEAGFAALDSLLHTSSYFNLTIAQMVERYAPPSQNNTELYIQQVCKYVGCSRSELVKDVLAHE